MNWEKVICLSPHSKQTAPEMVQIVDKSRGATSKKPVFFFFLFPVPVERVCSLPPKPTHGDHFLVYGPNDVLIALQYMCNQPYELSGNSQRTCLPNNTWSGTPPVCTQGQTRCPRDTNGRVSANCAKFILHYYYTDNRSENESVLRAVQHDEPALNKNNLQSASV